MASSADVILYDLRGHGMSDRPQQDYDLDTFVADLASLLDALKVERPVHLVGNSFGGLLALAFALAHRERVAGLVLVDALLPEPRWGKTMAATLGLEGEARDRMITESFQNWLGRHSARKRKRLGQVAEALIGDTTLVHDLEGSPGYPDESLGEIRCPVLAIYGAHSDMAERGERLDRTLPDCTLELFPGCTHSVLWQATQTLRDRIVRWLEDSVS